MLLDGVESRFAFAVVEVSDEDRRQLAGANAGPDPRDELVGGKLPVEVNGDKSAPDDPGVEPAVGSDTLGAASGEPAEPVSTPKPRAKPQVKPNARGVPKSRAPKKGRASKPAAPSTAPAPAAEAQPPPPASQPKAGKAPPTGSPLDLSNPYR